MRANPSTLLPLSPARPSGARGLARRLWGGRAIVLTVALFGTAGLYLVAQARELTAFQWQFHPGWLGLAVAAVMFIGPLGRVWLWCFTLRRLGAAMSLRDGFRILRLSQLGKYLPGHLWHYVGLLYLTRRAGVGRGAALSSLLYDQGAQLAAAGLAVIVLVQRSASLGSSDAIRTLAGACILIGVVFVHPIIFAAGMTRLPRVLRRSAARWLLGDGERLPVLPSRLAGGLILLNAGTWLILGTGLYALVRSVAGPAVPLLDSVVIGSVGIVAGFLVPFAPSGIGVTEGVMVLLLSRFLPVQVALAITVLFRVMNVAKEILLAAIALKLEPQARWLLTEPA
jgi:hypothetical protein